MGTVTYLARRSELEEYFDRTAADSWARLTSDVPVSGVRATARAGRDRMRATLLQFLPGDLRGYRILDAGCGTGALAMEAARRGADVTAIDLSPTLVQLARERAPRISGGGSLNFRVGDMVEAASEGFDYVVAMDSLIHYQPKDVVRTVGALARPTRRGVLFTFAPRTTMLTMMHALGKLFPRGDRSPAIVPVGRLALSAKLVTDDALLGWRIGRDARINSGFYISHAMEVLRR